MVPANVSQVSSNGLEKERGGVKTCITAGYCVKTNCQKVYNTNPQTILVHGAEVLPNPPLKSSFTISIVQHAFKIHEQNGLIAVAIHEVC